MTQLDRLYRDSLMLLTDLYELTMAQGYWSQGLADREAVFHVVFRREPFGGRYAVACGLSNVVDYLSNFRFAEDDLQYLAQIMDGRGRPLFAEPFVRYLEQLRFRCDVDAAAEGSLVFAHEPLVRVSGPLLQSQLLETALLNLVNFPTLIATKAARICSAAGSESILEFGLRRAQGIDGGVSASRAAYVGGCAATSNVLAGKLFDIPVKGTHAHSWVMAFDDELRAFEAYAEAMPHNCIFLVDTYDSLQGVRNAIRAARRLQQQGHEMIGIRLDSGDLAELSREARRMLNEAGFTQARIVASGDLDEYAIQRLRGRDARIDVWGVGTRLATAYDEPALGGVYKLAALRAADGTWDYRIKLSEHLTKISDPGLLQVRRYLHQGLFWGDAIYNLPAGISERPRLVDLRSGHLTQPPADCRWHDLLVPVFRRGQPVYRPPSPRNARRHCQSQLECLEPSIRRLEAPSPYRVGREWELHALKERLVREASEKLPP